MKKLSILISIAILFCQFPLSATAQKPTKQVKAADKYADKLRAFEQFVANQMQRDRIPGMTIGFTKDDYVWVKGFGYADLENKTPAKPESSYQTASILKGMTAAAILQLAEQGKINLDAEVQTYVSYFPKKKFPITIRQLLAHQGGISHYNNNWEKFIKEPKTTKETIAIFAGYDLVAEPGTKFSYSTYGYDLLGAVIEEVTKKSYGDYMRENVWKPLGMNNTRMDNPIEFIPNRVRGYQYFDDGENNALFGELKNAEYIDFSSRFAAGGARTTVLDMLKFRNGLNAGKLFSKESLNLTQTTSVTRDGKINGFGSVVGYTMGGFLTQDNGRFGVYYDGGQHGTTTGILNFPTENLTIAVAMNIQSRRAFAYIQSLFRMIMDEPLFASVYTGDKTSDDQVSAMKSVFEGGLSYFDIHHKPLGANQKEMAEAFAYFNKYSDKELLNSNREEALKKIGEGQQPFAGQPFTKLGSFMALKLSERYGIQQLKSYHPAGAISFFNDYIEMYKKESQYPKELQFSEPFEAMIVRWNSSWRKTNTEYVRTLAVTPETDFDAARRQLKKTFAGAEIYPDLGLNDFGIGTNGLNLFNTVQQLILKSDYKKAVRAAQLAVDIYPQSDFSNTALALAKLISGEKKEALTLFKKALEINAKGSAAAQNLYDIAQTWITAGQTEEGLKALIIAVELYPRESNIYESIGELYLKKNEKQEAIKFYKKALEINPNSVNAKQMLERLTIK